MLNIVIPMGGGAKSFELAGFSFPKPIIDVHGKTMIEVVVNNLRPSCQHKFIFVCFREHFDKYDLHNVFKRASNNKFEVVLINGPTAGQACTVLTTKKYTDSADELLIVNADQYIEMSVDDFLNKARQENLDGLIMTFNSTHPKWSYVRTDEKGRAVETAEKKVISNHATAGLYYFKHGSDFIGATEAMIHKDIRFNNQFYVCPSYNELILEDKKIYIYDIIAVKMHGMGTPEDLNAFLNWSEENKIQL